MDLIMDSAETLHTYVLPVSAVVLCLYPPILFLRMLTAGLARTSENNDNDQMLDGESTNLLGSIGAGTTCAALTALAPLLLLFPGSLGFTAGANVPMRREVPDPVWVGMDFNPDSERGVHKSLSSSVCGSVGCLMGVAMVSIAMRSLFQTVARARAERAERRKLGKAQLRRNFRGLLRRCASGREGFGEAEAPDHGLADGFSVWDALPGAASHWHQTDLFVRDWLDEDTGLFRYVNEMPRGSLQKFELQTTLENNVLREDEEGSRRLRSFGIPVPFNYGCFPQTYRDPDEHDELHDAPGDNDPLDVIDLCQTPASVGDVVVCRPLGAVCLIDEGQADWKILVVNTQIDSPLAAARSTAEVELLWPGRIKEILLWMDDFKQHSSRGRRRTKLHSEVHSSEVAISLITKDHLAWRRLVSKVDAFGYACGHWIARPRASPEVLHVAWQTSHAESPLTGATKPNMALTEAAQSAQALRWQSASSSSDGETSSSDRTP